MINQPKNVFMIGWEYPPNNSGGLGVACEGLTQALSQEDTHIDFSLPYQSEHQVSHMDIHNCVHQSWIQPVFDERTQQFISTQSPALPPFFAYSAEAIVRDNLHKELARQATQQAQNSGYSFDLEKLRKLSNSQLGKQVNEYAQVVAQVGSSVPTEFDVIHAHDWMSFPAGNALRKKTGKPFIAHVHSTEYDRAGLTSGNEYIEAVEYEGMHSADRVIAVSYYTKRLLVDRYGVDANKISVVHNGISALNTPADPGTHHFASNRPVIVFMGRLTIQKGVTYFLDLARSVLKKIPEALFVVAGHGDMYHELLIKTAHNGLSAQVVFSGFVRDEQQRMLLNRADVFVMPSLSEPFGLVALEAAQRHTPVIVSKNAGVGEVLSHAVALDFWDIDEMTNTIIELVANKKQAAAQVRGQLRDIAQQSWARSAQRVKQVYKQAFIGR